MTRAPFEKPMPIPDDLNPSTHRPTWYGTPSGIQIVDFLAGQTHMYPPSYIKLLSSRTTVPYIHQPSEPGADPRLIILASDDDTSRPKSSRGRPVDETYSSFDSKRQFMTTHGITCSVISLANPWLDFVEPSSALSTAQEINDDLERACAENNSSPASKDVKLYAFGCLPLSAPAKDVVSEIQRLKTLRHVKGVIMGTTGLGNGLDDPALDDIYAALASTSTLVFLHPHYGLPDSAFGGPEVVAQFGHVLPLALGFPLETTIAVSRMYLSGVFDRHAKLEFLLAHSGGTLPFLAGRIESCVAHEREFIANGGHRQGPQRSIWDVLQSNIYLDAVIYGQPGLKAAIEAAGSVDRVMFGTDHPFFPPLGDEEDAKWLSVESNKVAIGGCFPQDQDARRKILGGNAVRVLGLDV
ncbi:hypothetical protein PV08_09250 [Exophiala spinifera]|uniref:Amidohydrolase-related domain-containing protein n=1 Tax=Exophiala spinifera TaxID=91928 RepID=A0A0D1YAM8_9EURO|nr:uncharacterized protein PV08_09250 [Exophiala spinifera]KIW11976.1 hypothetical protein PV08_09250 [Exophiala spinifera]